jgi:MFS family permease
VRYFALLSIAVMAGFGLSPVFAAFMEGIGYSLNDAFYITAALCFVSAVIFFVLIKPVQQHAINPAAETPSRLSLNAVAKILKSTALTPIIMVCMGASVFAGMNNFQTVFADERGLEYAGYFLAYTITVIIFRVLLAKFKGGKNPYLIIAALQYVMCGSVLLFIFSGSNPQLYLLVACLFGIGYGASYPILTAMTANDALEELLPQTLQLFALTYFIGIFAFPLIAGWMIVEVGTTPLLYLVAGLAAIEATMALRRSKGAQV